MAIRILLSPARRAFGSTAPGTAPLLRGALALASLLLAAGCGSGSSATPAGPLNLSGATQVTLVLGSTANDKLAEYDVNFQGITLTSDTGNTITLLNTAQDAEFIHLNGAAQPVLTVSVPQGIYTAATANINSVGMTCLGLASNGGLFMSIMANGPLTGNPTVTLPQPITISGSNLGLSLNMQVSQSGQPGSCNGPSNNPFTTTPAFTLSTFALAGATPSASTRLPTLDATVNSVDAATGALQVTLAAASSPAGQLAVRAGPGTSTQGFNGLGALAAGQFVQIDGSLQADGSLLASRILLADPAATDVAQGPVVSVWSAAPYLTLFPRLQQGKDPHISTETFDYSNASFRIGGGFTNLSSLPFTAGFSAASVVAGQEVYVSSPAFNQYMPPDYNAPATTITLEPQTLDGTVLATATSGEFRVYTVQLADYNLFPALAVQPGQTTQLGTPTTVQVYVDASARTYGTTAPVVGATLRFHGLVFNDGGTLRMDCDRINDGVAF